MTYGTTSCCSSASATSNALKIFCSRLFRRSTLTSNAAMTFCRRTCVGSLQDLANETLKLTVASSSFFRSRSWIASAAFCRTPNSAGADSSPFPVRLFLGRGPVRNFRWDDPDLQPPLPQPNFSGNVFPAPQSLAPSSRNRSGCVFRWWRISFAASGRPLQDQSPNSGRHFPTRCPPNLTKTGRCRNRRSSPKSIFRSARELVSD